MWGDDNDRYRSHAMEVGFGNFVIGSNVYTNQVKNFVMESNSDKKPLSGSVFGTHNTWVDGKVYSSPAYIGVKSKNKITRVGVDTPIVADLTQNFALFILGGNFFPRGTFQTKPYYQTGQYLPYSLY